MRKRPGAARAVLKRPAADLPRGAEQTKRQSVPRNKDVLEGEVSQLPWDLFKVGVVGRFCGTYQGQTSDFVGEIKSREEDSSDKWLRCKPWGSPSSSVSEWVKKEKTKGRLGLLKVQICRQSCVPEVGIEGLFHCKEVKLPAEDLEWKSNLLERGGDTVLPGLASLAHEMGYGAVTPQRREGEQETKGKQKKEKEAQSGQSSTSSSSQAGKGGKKERKRKRKRKQRRRVKEMEDKSKWTWKGTSLDPSFKPPKVSLSKPKATSSTEGTVGSDEDQLFPETQRVRKIARSCPGLLSRQVLKEAKSSLAFGVGESANELAVSPVMLKYFRQVLLTSNLTKSMQKESLTLCTALDLILEGRILRSMDVLVQRLKAIEMVSRGASWDLAERIEIIKERSSLFSQAEASSALAEAKRERSVSWGMQSQWTQDGWKGKGGKGDWAKDGLKKGLKGEKGEEKGYKGGGKRKEQPNAARTEVRRPT